MASQKLHQPDQPLLRSHILDAARVIVVRQGFDALSMRKLADVVGYSPASLYLHFSGRDAIAHALGAEGHATLLAALHTCDSIPDEVERLKSMAHAYVEFARLHPALYRLIFMQNVAYTQAIVGNAATCGETVLSVFAQTLAVFNQPPLAAGVLWTTLHGIASLSLTAAPFLPVSPDMLVNSALDPYLSGVKKKRAPRLSSSRAA